MSEENTTTTTTTTTTATTATTTTAAVEKEKAKEKAKETKNQAKAKEKEALAVMSEENTKRISACDGGVGCKNYAIMKQLEKEKAKFEMESTVHLMAYQEQQRHCSFSYLPVMKQKQDQIDELKAEVARLEKEKAKVQLDSTVHLLARIKESGWLTKEKEHVLKGTQ